MVNEKNKDYNVITLLVYQIYLSIIPQFTGRKCMYYLYCKCTQLHKTCTVGTNWLPVVGNAKMSKHNDKKLYRPDLDNMWTRV